MSNEDRVWKVSRSGHEYSEPLVMLWFSTDWCAPCKQLKPIMNAVAGQYESRLNVIRINTDEQQDIAREFGVRAVPTLVLVGKDQVLDSKVGLNSAPVLSQWIEQHLHR